MAHEDRPELQHHFETPTQQFESGKLGMWLFLATEILLFGGLFCAYAVYRANHPEVFVYASQYLSRTWGGINTLVLIFSSLTMAWAVRAAQLGKRKQLVTLLSLTLLCAFGFLGIKYVEYQDKWRHGLLPGVHYQPHHEDEGHGEAAAPGEEAANAGETGHDEEASGAGEAAGQETEAAPAETAPAAPAEGALEPAEERSQILPPPPGPAGLAPEPEAAAEAGDGGSPGKGEDEGEGPTNVHIFFGVYFLMTGLHGVHVLAGMVVIGWLIRRSIRGDFGSNYFTPVDLGGLYWHLVDLIWIFLFPLLYLIE
jgi:cytochrome c oxidase subunit 3